MHLKRGLTAAVGVMLTTSLAYGLHPQLSLQEIAQKADLIFVGTVTRQNSHYNARRTAIETDVTFTDVRIEHETERARQRGANTIRLTYGGGTVGDVTFGVSDSPSFETGRRYLVFMIDDDSRPFNPVVGAYQGMFEVIRRPRYRTGVPARTRSSRGRRGCREWGRPLNVPATRAVSLLEWRRSHRLLRRSWPPRPIQSPSNLAVLSGRVVNETWTPRWKRR